MVDKNKVIMGISCGDINGVGLEIIIKLFSNKDVFDSCIPILYAPQQVIDDYKSMYPEFNHFNYHLIDAVDQAISSELNVLAFWSKSVYLHPGVPTREGAEIAIQSLELATQHLKTQTINILLTLPLNKQNISTINKSFVGHTEYLSNNTNSDNSLMVLCDKKLRIATLTNHLPISKVTVSITKKMLKQKIDILIQTLKIDFAISEPKIAVLGLNPHAGDSGLIGHEEKSIIAPVVYEFSSIGHLVYGPFSADGFFGSAQHKKFDAILGMYHDQALIPFKLMSFGRGVNYTAGLPVIRVSPDHGVGYGIAGKNIAQENSVKSAILLGIELYKTRNAYFDGGIKNQTT
jgi:4-hydroxythreonine-4-phosphate dehydrogenase